MQQNGLGRLNCKSRRTLWLQEGRSRVKKRQIIQRQNKGKPSGKERSPSSGGRGGGAAVKPSSGETLGKVGTHTITQSVRVGHRPHSRRLRGADHWGLK